MFHLTYVVFFQAKRNFIFCLGVQTGIPCFLKDVLYVSRKVNTINFDSNCKSLPFYMFSSSCLSNLIAVTFKVSIITKQKTFASERSMFNAHSSFRRLKKLIWLYFVWRHIKNRKIFFSGFKSLYVKQNPFLMNE